MATEVAARPLGVRPEIELSAAQRQTLQALQDYDLAPIRERLVKEGAMPSTWVDEAVLEFRRYLALRTLFPGTSLQMFSRQIDAVWHTCLLFSRKYAEWCNLAFGQFVHHEPATAPMTPPEAEYEWQAFADAYERAFGPLPRLWQMAKPKPHDTYVD